MSRNPRSLRLIGGVGLAAAVLAMRVPFRAHTLFEFDSIDFAVAAFRFDLHEVTPHMPGYILHVLLGRLLNLFTSNTNAAYVWLSIILSVGSVLFLWRAAAQIRGERVAILAALIWLTLPLFWFHGCVALIYVEEAFWTPVILYLGIKLRNNYQRSLLFLLLIAYSLAGAARPNDLLFFFPAILFVIVTIKPPRKDILLAIVCFASVTAIWIAELLRESGGLWSYVAAARAETNYRTQSVLFGASWRSQLDTIAKVIFYFALAFAGPLIALVGVLAVYPKRTIDFIRSHARNSKARFVLLLAVPALLFYALVFFMKAGYLLNVVPSVILIAAILLDQGAIWFAERTKRRDANPLRLTRPIVTRNVVWISGAVIMLNCLWFFIPWSGTEQERYNNENTRNSFVHGAWNRYEHSSDRELTLANRAFEYANISGIRAVDRLNETTYRALIASGAAQPGSVIIATWWSRWCYYLFPQATTIDIETAGHEDSLAVGISSAMHRENIAAHTIRIQSPHSVFLLMRHDRPDFPEVSRQLHLERLPLPEYLDIYRITDSTFDFDWGGRDFIRNRADSVRHESPLPTGIASPHQSFWR